MLTIEQHYASLHKRALEARRAATPARWPGLANRDLVARVRARATALAAQDWPRVRAAIAARQGAMPLEPLRYGDSGTVADSVGIFSVCRQRGGEAEELDYPGLAVVDLAPELEREALAAEGAFARYAQAVAQGVAQEPGSEVAQ